MKCPLCGREFDESEALHCAGCAVKRTCGHLRCPRCGYEVLPEPPGLKAVRGLLGRGARRGARRGGTEAGWPLTDLRPGEGAVVVGVDLGDPRRVHKLMVLGVIPGAKVRLIQRFPSYVFQVGQTQVAFDRETAATIYIRPLKVNPGSR